MTDTANPAAGAPGTSLVAAPATEIIGGLTELALKETLYRDEKERAEMETAARDAIAEVYRELFRRVAENQFLLEEERVNTSLVDRAIERLDEQISAQLDAVMHHPEFQRLESAWRGLRYLVDRAPVAQNIELTMMSVRPDELDNDLADQTWEKSGFIRHLHSDGLGIYGGKPYAAVVANYEFTPKTRDMRMLRNLAACGSAAQAPVIAAASPELLGLDDIRNLPNHADHIVAKQRENAKRFRDWTSFRNHPDSRYVCLTMPRFLLRDPYGPDTRRIQTLNYVESAGDSPKDYLWGNTAFALASRLAQCFAENRWYNRIVGEKSGGIVERLPMYTYRKDGIEELTCPTETYLNANQEKTLSNLGFTALTMHRNESHAVFFAAQSVFDPTVEGQGEAADQVKGDRALAAGLPYTLIVTRISHYVTQMLYAHLGSQNPNKGALQDFVADWIRGYCVDMEKVDPRILLERPLKSAEVKVEDWKGHPGYYTFDLRVTPHFHFAGAQVNISLDGYVKDPKQ